MAAVIFAVLVGFLTIGFVWFWIARPILEDYGIIRVNDYQEAAPVVMPRSVDSAPQYLASSLETDAETDGRTEQAPPLRAEQLFPLYQAMRAAAMSREDAQAACKASGLPFNNNVWAKAAPRQNVGAEYVTPIVGRATSARFETDQDFPYQAPAH